MPGFNSDNRAVWKRTAWVKGPAGHNVEIDATSAKKLKKADAGIVGMSPSEYGRKCERDAAALFRKQGYTTTLAHLSRGASDLLAVNAKETLQIQVKSASKPERLFPALRACMKDMRGMPEGARRYGLIYLYRHGLVLELELAGNKWRMLYSKTPVEIADVHAVFAKTETTALKRK